MYEQKTNKLTKIIATISDLKCNVEFIKKLYDKGMNVVRVNTAHQTPDDTLKIINNVRAVSSKIPVMIDTKGPEVRTTKTDGVISFTEGNTIFVSGNKTELSNAKTINVSYENLIKEVNIGNKILIDDGVLELDVIEKDDDKLTCKVLNDGSFEGRKSVNVPGIHLDLPSLTKKDIEYVHFAAKNNVEFIAHSFVRNKEDILEIKKILSNYDTNVEIIAKIENQEGVDNIDEILENCFGIMVARGDLAIEIPGYKVPIVQKKLIKSAIRHRKVSIVATQMLHSMIESPRPTRAEMSDVANAIYDGTDAVMLSGETAYGKYPVSSVKMMTSIAEQVELETRNCRRNLLEKDDCDVAEFLSLSSVRASEKLGARAIITDTATGNTPKKLSAMRGSKPIFSFCYSRLLTRQLALCRGVYTKFMEKAHTTDEFLKWSLSYLIRKDLVLDSDLIVVIAGSFTDAQGATFMEICNVKHLV